MTTNELWAKFVEWMKSREGYPFAGQFVNTMWTAYQAAHASRDAEVEALRSELAEARDGWHQANGVADLAIQHRDAAEAEVEVLRKYVARLNWLEQDMKAGSDGTSIYYCLGKFCYPYSSSSGIGEKYESTLREAIDAAMREESK